MTDVWCVWRAASCQQVERVAADHKRLRLRFDWATQRDYLVEFQDSNARESFCALLLRIAPMVSSVEEGEHEYVAHGIVCRGRGLTSTRRSVDDFTVAYDVQVVAPSGLRKRRTLLLDRTNRAVYRVANKVLCSIVCCDM